jgi:hypothetical protein
VRSRVEDIEKTINALAVKFRPNAIRLGKMIANGTFEADMKRICEERGAHWDKRIAEIKAKADKAEARDPCADCAETMGLSMGYSPCGDCSKDGDDADA